MISLRWIHKWSGGPLHLQQILISPERCKEPTEVQQSATVNIPDPKRNPTPTLESVYREATWFPTTLTAYYPK